MRSATAVLVPPPQPLGSNSFTSTSIFNDTIVHAACTLKSHSTDLIVKKDTCARFALRDCFVSMTVILGKNVGDRLHRTSLSGEQTLLALTLDPCGLSSTISLARSKVDWRGKFLLICRWHDAKLFPPKKCQHYRSTVQTSVISVDVTPQMLEFALDFLFY